MTASPVTRTLDDFKLELPGLESRGYRTYAVAIAFAHSGRFNTRGLECHSNVFCSRILEDLAIVLVRAIFKEPVTASSPPVFVHWDEVKIETLRVGMLVEVKGRATRSAKNPQAFRVALESKLHLACVYAWEQATAAFIAHEETNRLILVAFSGERFSWRLAVRKDFGIEALPRRRIIKEADEDELSDGSGSELGADNPQLIPIQRDIQGLNQGCPAATGERRELPVRKQTRNISG